MLPALDHFHFCPFCGASSIERTQETAIRCPSCSFEFYMSPAASAAALIEDAHGRILVVKRAKDPSKGKFGLPGGFADVGETLEESLQREVREEVNITLESWSFLGGWPNQYAYKSVIYAVVDNYYTANVENFDSLRSCQEELESVHFVDPKSVDPEDWAFPSLRNAIQCYLNLR